MIYLAVPYSHEDPAVMEERFQIANRAAAALMRRGLYVYSPISHSHPIAQYGLPFGWDYWQGFDRFMLGICTKLLVVMADGWDESKGIAAEVEEANRRGLRVDYINPIELWRKHEHYNPS